MDEKRYLQQAIKLSGSQSELARRLANATSKPIRQAHVWNWLHRDQKVPAEMAIPIERAVDGKVSRHDLRPDIYPRSDAA